MIIIIIIVSNALNVEPYEIVPHNTRTLTHWITVFPIAKFWLKASAVRHQALAETNSDEREYD